MKFFTISKIYVLAFVFCLATFGAPDCKYNNNINLEGPDNGEPIAVFKTIPDSHAFDAWKYDQILLCRRPEGQGAYAIVIDINHVANPPQEIVTNSSPDGYSIRLVLNTADTHGRPNPELTSGDIDLIIYPAANGNPENAWVFERNPARFGGESLLESSMTISWGNWTR